MPTPTPEEREECMINAYKEFCKDRGINVIGDLIEHHRRYYGLNLKDLSLAQQDLLREILLDFDNTGKLDVNFEDIRRAV